MGQLSESGTELAELEQYVEGAIKRAAKVSCISSISHLSPVLLLGFDAQIIGC